MPLTTFANDGGLLKRRILCRWVGCGVEFETVSRRQMYCPEHMKANVARNNAATTERRRAQRRAQKEEAPRD